MASIITKTVQRSRLIHVKTSVSDSAIAPAPQFARSSSPVNVDSDFPRDSGVANDVSYYDGGSLSLQRPESVGIDHF